MRHGGLAEVEHREHVRAEHEVELLGRDLEEGVVRHLKGRVVDQHVELPELAERAVDQTLRMRAVADVARHRDAAPAGVFDEARGLGGVLVLVEVGRQDVGALACERDRDRPPDPRVGAGDQRHLVLEAAVADVALLAVVGERAHVGLAPRRLLLLLGKRRPGLGLSRMLLLGHGDGLPTRAPFVAAGTG